MKLVITGALGHIGSRLLRDLRPGVYSEILLIDNLSTQRYGSLFDLPRGVPFRFLEEDILASDLKRHFEGARAVVHLAAVTEAAASFERPEQVDSVNYGGTERVAEACLATGARLVFPSTTSVYGIHAGVAREDCPESDLNPQTPYAAGKLRAEKLLRSLGRARGLEFVICRFGTVFGASPGMRFHTAVNRFVWQACLGRPLTVWRTALDQTRPYLDVADAAGALSFLLRHASFDRGTYNVVTVHETAASIVEAVRRHVPDLVVRLTDSRAMNSLSYEASTDRLSRAGFVPAGSLDRGIRETVDLLRNARSFSAPPIAGGA